MSLRPPRGYREMRPTPAVRELIPGVRVFDEPTRHLRVLFSIDHGWRHASISHPDRFPTWEEILEVRDACFPAEMEVVMVLARRSEYVNLHGNTFHLWQSRCGEEGR